MRGPETFTFARFTWNVDLARVVLARSPRPSEPVPVAKLAPLLGLIRVNEDHVDAVDVTQPVLLAPMPHAEEEWLICIDGWHRIAKAVRLSLETLPAVTLTAEESNEARLPRPRRTPRRKP